jgi:lipoprotein-anchoring transpeptidase ErfK/SrfK
VRVALVRERVGLLHRTREVVGGSGGAGRDLARLEVLAAEAEGYFERGDDDRAAAAAERAAHLLARQEADWARELERYADPGTVAGWGRLVRDLIRWSASHRAPAIAVSKADLRLSVYLGGRSVAAYPVTLGINGFRQKLRAGDGATPEGRYRVTAKRGTGETRYYKALLLDYPNAEDRRRFVARRGAGALPGRVGLGGLIEIHGGVADEAGRTLGCIGLANRDMDAVFERVTTGTPVVIVGATSRDNAVVHLFTELGNGKHTDGPLGH